MTRHSCHRIVLAVLASVACTVPASSEGLYTLTSNACRLVDTRVSGGPLSSGSVRVFTAVNNCGIPSSATALYVNLTAVAPTVAGFLTIFPSDGTYAGVSTVNFAAGDTAIGNAALVRLSPTGLFSIYMGGAGPGTVHVTVDIQGYYAPYGPLLFHAIASCRLLDTRLEPAGSLQHLVPRALRVQDKCGVPRGAKAVTGTITSVLPTSYGNMVVFPYGASAPGTSNLNFPLPTNSYARANGVLAPLATVSGDADPDLYIRAALTDGGSAHVVFDVTGYYQ